MMHATDVLFYTFEAGTHCSACTIARFGEGEGSPIEHPWVPEDAVDSEGNSVHPVFASDDTASVENCGTCDHLICGTCGQTCTDSEREQNGGRCRNCRANINTQQFRVLGIVAGAIADDLEGPHCDGFATYDEAADAAETLAAEYLRDIGEQEDWEVTIGMIYVYADSIEGSQWAGEETEIFAAFYREEEE